MTEPLVDAEGFPRNDIDVREVRLARSQINSLHLDLKELLKEIEIGLEEIHKEGAHLTTDAKPPQSSHSNAGHSSNAKPIVIVNLVSPGSPSEEAGIAVRDKIISIGTINSTNFKDLAQIGELIKSCQNKSVPVRILRDTSTIELTLVPKTWSGRGLLGCNIVPIPE
jgi:26S proteasome non-ATPase regulatory subunit 9